MSNLYILPEYRGRRIASNLCGEAMRWFRSLTDPHTLYVYVSNGNEAVVSLFKGFGFRFSHAVFDGFLTAYYQTL